MYYKIVLIMNDMNLKIETKKLIMDFIILLKQCQIGEKIRQNKS